MVSGVSFKSTKIWPMKSLSVIESKSKTFSCSFDHPWALPKPRPRPSKAPKAAGRRWR